MCPPSSLVQFSGRVTSYLPGSVIPISACSRNLQMKFAYSQPSTRDGSLAANGAGVVREAMRGRSGRGGSRTSGEPRAGRFIWCLGRPLCGIISGQKATRPNLGLPFALDAWAPMEFDPPARTAGLFVPSNKTTQREEPTSLL